jgi:putative flippase GtrA
MGQAAPPVRLQQAQRAGAVATRQEPRREFLSFALVGVVGTITHYATILALIQFAGTSPVMGTLAESRA